MLDHRALAPLSELLPLSQLQLGRAYVVSGDTAKARTAYQDFSLYGRMLIRTFRYCKRRGRSMED
jgi:hypothetical protein